MRYTELNPTLLWGLFDLECSTLGSIALRQHPQSEMAIIGTALIMRRFRQRQTRAVRFHLLLMVVVCALLADRLVVSRLWVTNLAAIQTAAQVVSYGECSGLLDRHGYPGSVVTGQTPFLRAVTLAHGVPNGVFPAQGEWTRDPQLWNLFRAQALIHDGNFPASVPYLQNAHAAPLLLAATDTMYGHQDYACFLQYRLLAEIVGGRSSSSDLDAFVSGLFKDGHAAQVAAGYAAALRYQPTRSDWRLTQARALLRLGRVSDAELAVAPLLQGSVADRRAAIALIEGSDRVK